MAKARESGFSKKHMAKPVKAKKKSKRKSREIIYEESMKI
jgi:hypothetical protein